jgi:hypothetical protein
MTREEETSLQNKRTALQRDIYKWSIAQESYMLHMKYARNNSDFSFNVIHGTPPDGNLVYTTTKHNVSPDRLALLVASSCSAQPPPVPSLAAASPSSFLPVASSSSLPAASYSSPAAPPSPLPAAPSSSYVAAPTASSVMRPTLATITAAPSSDALKRKHQEDSDSQRGSPTQLRKSTNDIIDIDNAEHINLWMPSDLPAAVRLSVCSQAAVNAEFQLLLTETHDLLVSVRKYRQRAEVSEAIFCDSFLL